MKKDNIIKHISTVWAFTLIELLIVIMILGMMLTATYAPYSHYQKKALLKQGQKEIVQSIYEARNLAINGLNFDDWANIKNVSVWLYMDTSNALKTNLTYFSYPHQTNETSLGDPTLLPSDRIIKTKDLPNHIWLDAMERNGAPLPAGQQQFLFLYNAINGDWRYYAWNWAWGLSEVIDTEVDVNISYKWATTDSLRDEIIYYTETYIADYK